MSMTPTRFRKIPVEIEAVQLTFENRGDVYEWVCRNAKLGGNIVGISLKAETRNPVTHPSLHGQMVLLLQTLEGELAAYPGDWIIKGVAGQFCPCPDDIFRKTYEEVP